MKEINMAGKHVISTFDKDLICWPTGDDISDLAPCTQEEANTRMLVHLLLAAKQGHKKVLVRTINRGDRG